MEGVLRGLFTLSALVAVFLLGGTAVVFDLPLTRDLRGALYLISGKFPLVSDRDPDSEFNQTFRLWLKPRTKATGVTRIDRSAAMPGHTLYTDQTDQEARLVDLDGHLLHVWRLRLRDIWEAGQGTTRPEPYDVFRWEKVRLFPDGSLMALIMSANETVYGRGLIRIDKDSHLVWKNLAPIHHDFDIGPDGRIYALAHRLAHVPLPGATVVKPPYLTDEVLIIGPDGRTLRSIDLAHAIATSSYRNILNLITEHANGDYFHANNVDYVTQAEARTHPFAKAGELLLSFRELDLLALLDPEAERITWATRGSWHGQHDPDMLSNENMIVFDNNGQLGPGGRSRVLEFNPVNHKIIWSYTGPPDDPLDVRARGSQQRLENGDTLITDSYAPRIIEVTPSGRIVWEFYNPNRAGLDGASGTIRSGERIPAEAIHFTFNYGKIGKGGETAAVSSQ